MLHLQNIAFEFGGHYLFRNVDWYIKARERIGLVGKNGAGKSTLLKIITGQYELREGRINQQSGTRLGYLSQDMISENEQLSVLETARLAFKEVLELQERIDEAIALVEKDHSNENIQLLTDLQERFTALDGYQVDYRTAEILEGLGFSTADLNRPLSEFSGGWRMRAILARMLLEQPDIMLMDEPTNHLDLPSIQWLETYLSTYPGAVVIVSHDREFLNRMTNTTAEISNQQLYIWGGNYDFYLHAKVERDSLIQRKAENQKQFIKDQEKFIERFRSKATKAKAVQSRIKMLDKLDPIEELRSDGAAINIDFRVSQRSGKKVMDLRHIDKSFGSQSLFKDVNIHIQRGDKIALIGANGTGKSTFLRIIANQESFEGEREEGHNVSPSFYAQHQLESLSLKDEILEELKHAAPSKPEGELRALLGCFLFTGDDVFKKIKVLSGGEKARVALAKTLVSEANFLLLDEPTNHLDIDSIEILIEALQRYEGTLILVSHNRYFISRLANKIWWIEDQDVKTYPGTYEEFLHRQSSRESDSHMVKEPKVQKQQKGAWKQKDDRAGAVKKLHRRLTEAEEHIASLQQKKTVLESELTQLDPSDTDRFAQAGQDLKALQESLESAQEKALDLMDQLIRLEEE